MTSASLSFISAELDVDVHEPGADAIERVCEALRAFRVIGLVDNDTEGRAGAVSAMLAFVPGQGLLVETSDGVAPTPVQPILDAVSARVGADVMFSGGDEELIATVTDQGAESEEDDAENEVDTTETVFIVGGKLPLAPDRRGEIAHQLESDVVVAPLGHRTLVVARRNAPFAYWSRAQRPVIALQRTTGELAAHVYSSGAVRTGRMRERIVMGAIPDWMALWDPAPILLVDGTDAEDGVAPEVQRRLMYERQHTLQSLALTDEAVLAETQIDGAALTALLGRPIDDTLVDDVVAALRLPRDVAALVNGQRSAETLPGAIAIENRGLKGALADTLYVEPEGSSFWARWRRLPHRHPRAAVALIVAELALAGGLVWGATLASWPSPWSTVAWVVAIVMAIDAVGDALLLGKIRRLKRAAA